MENTSMTGPPSLDSEYDEYLAIPDIGDCSTLGPFTISNPTCNYGADDLPIGKLYTVVLSLIYQFIPDMLQAQ